jgi:hypothetical protein
VPGARLAGSVCSCQPAPPARLLCRVSPVRGACSCLRPAPALLRARAIAHDVRAFPAHCCRRVNNTVWGARVTEDTDAALAVALALRAGSRMCIRCPQHRRRILAGGAVADSQRVPSEHHAGGTVVASACCPIPRCLCAHAPLGRLRPCVHRASRAPTRGRSAPHSIGRAAAFAALRAHAHRTGAARLRTPARTAAKAEERQAQHAVTVPPAPHASLSESALACRAAPRARAAQARPP